MNDLKEKTIRGSFVRILAQAANFLFRIGSLMILARLLGPQDFGLVGMATAFTGVLNLFRDFGLSTASVQRENVTEEQISALFWINVLMGLLLAGLALIFAPVVVHVYHEPRLLQITMILASGFVFNALGVQHSAQLQRHLRFTALAVINVGSLVVSTVVGMTFAKLGFGYWALVAMTVTLPAVSTIGVWIAAAWIPGMPRRGAGIRSMIRFGGTLTLNGLVVYLAYNMEKVLLGRFWGAEALGLYGRAYQLANLPVQQLYSSISTVALPTMCRIQDDVERLRRSFLRAYSALVALMVPVVIACAVFAEEIVHTLL